jgi:hypothetical protein
MKDAIATCRDRGIDLPDNPTANEVWDALEEHSPEVLDGDVGRDLVLQIAEDALAEVRELDRAARDLAARRPDLADELRSMGLGPEVPR